MALADTLRVMNPHWTGEAIEKSFVPRSVQKELMDNLKLRQIQDILGVRRSGKTTVLHLTIKTLIEKGVEPEKIVILSFDDITIGTSSFEDIEQEIFQTVLEPEYMFIDEAQEKKGWEKWVKNLYDRNTFQKIFISGSNASLLSSDIGKLLTGRHITSTIMPFSFKEFLDAYGVNKNNKNTILNYLIKYLQNGGFPETLYTNRAHVILSNTYTDILARDIATRYDIDKEKMDFLAKYLFTNIAKEYSYNKIAETINLNFETVQRYLGYLHDSYLFFSLKVFSYKLKTQYKQNKKIYAIDPGLRNAVSFQFSEDIGKLYENTVFLELKRQNKDIYYWKGRGEADFIIRHGLKVTDVIQVCYKPRPREVRALVEAGKVFKLKRGMVITHAYEKKEVVDDMIVEFIPLWRWLLRYSKDTTVKK